MITLTTKSRVVLRLRDGPFQPTESARPLTALDHQGSAVSERGQTLMIMEKGGFWHTEQPRFSMINAWAGVSPGVFTLHQECMGGRASTPMLNVINWWAAG